MTLRMIQGPMVMAHFPVRNMDSWVSFCSTLSSWVGAEWSTFIIVYTIPIASRRTGLSKFVSFPPDL